MYTQQNIIEQIQVALNALNETDSFKKVQSALTIANNILFPLKEQATIHDFKFTVINEKSEKDIEVILSIKDTIDTDYVDWDVVLS
jgi:hypothetical protein